MRSTTAAQFNSLSLLRERYDLSLDSQAKLSKSPARYRLRRYVLALFSGCGDGGLRVSD
jgi:hypothetical protein